MARNLLQGWTDNDDNSSGNLENQNNLNKKCMNFGMVMTDNHSCVKGLPMYYTNGTWHTNMTF